MLNSRSLPALALTALAALAAFTRSANAQSVGLPDLFSPKDPIFKQGTQDILFTAGYGFPFLGDHDHYTEGAIGYGYYLLDQFSLNANLSLNFADTQQKYAIGGEFNLMMRWHFLQYEKWTLFVDAGAGVSQWDHQLPPPGTQFNFSIRGGPGLTYQLTDNLHFVLGTQYLHYSNAGIQGGERHTGSNAWYTYAGLMWTF